MDGKSGEIKIYGDGEQTRDFVYVKDVVDACVSALDLSGVYNVSVGKETSVNEIVSKIKELIGDVDVEHLDPIPGELRNNYLDSGKLIGEGWKPDYDLDSGMKETVDWFKG